MAILHFFSMFRQKPSAKPQTVTLTTITDINPSLSRSYQKSSSPCRKNGTRQPPLAPHPSHISNYGEDYQIKFEKDVSGGGSDEYGICDKAE